MYLQYYPPKRKALTQTILRDEFNFQVSNLKTMLEEVEYVSLTTDAWTSDSTVSYLTITAHFIHKDSLNAWVLSTNEIDTSHTS